MNRKALFVAAVSAALGLILLFFYQHRFETEAAGGRPVPVLFAVQEIAMGEQLTEAKLGVRNIPEAYLEERHIRRQDLRRVVGVGGAATIPAHHPVRWDAPPAQPQWRRAHT